MKLSSITTPVLLAILIVPLCANGNGEADIDVTAFPCDVNDALDLSSPPLTDAMLAAGIGVDPNVENSQIVQRLLQQRREEQMLAKAYVVQITNRSDSALSLQRKNVRLALTEGAADDIAPDNDSVPKASKITNWAGKKALCAKAKNIQPQKTVTGIVYFELSPTDLQAPDVSPEVVYVPEKGTSVTADSEPALLRKVGLEWSETAPTKAPPMGEPRIFPAMGNVDDKTPLSVKKPGKLKPAPSDAVVAHDNIVGKQQMGGTGGRRMPGMGGAGMGGQQGRNMPGMGGIGGQGGRRGGGGGQMPGMPGAGQQSGGQQGGGGGGAQLPGKPGTLPGG